MPDSRVKCTCLKCGAEFFRYPSNIVAGEGKYCSRNCFYTSDKKPPSLKRNGRYVPCQECGKMFYTVPSIREQGKGKYCSRKCMSNKFEGRTGKLNCHYKGESHSFRSKNGNREYLFVRDKDGIFKPEYRLIAEKVLGRPLNPNEKVHHVDMNPNNNKNSNLLICSNSYHSWLHHRYARRFAELHLNEVSNGSPGI